MLSLVKRHQPFQDIRIICLYKIREEKAFFGSGMLKIVLNWMVCLQHIKDIPNLWKQHLEYLALFPDL